MFVNYGKSLVFIICQFLHLFRFTWALSFQLSRKSLRLPGAMSWTPGNDTYLYGDFDMKGFLWPFLPIPVILEETMVECLHGNVYFMLEEITKQGC